MMEMIANWIKTIAATSIAGAVIYFLVPKGNLEKSVKLVVSFSLIFSVLYPFISGTLKGNVDLADFKAIKEIEEEADEKAMYYGQEYSKIIYEKTTSEIENNISDFLDGMEVKYNDIEIHTDITENGSIVISKVRIVLLKNETQERLDTIQEEIITMTGVKPDFDVSHGE